MPYKETRTNKNLHVSAASYGELWTDCLKKSFVVNENSHIFQILRLTETLELSWNIFSVSKDDGIVINSFLRRSGVKQTRDQAEYDDILDSQTSDIYQLKFLIMFSFVMKTIGSLHIIKWIQLESYACLFLYTLVLAFLK